MQNEQNATCFLKRHDWIPLGEADLKIDIGVAPDMFKGVVH